MEAFDLDAFYLILANGFVAFPKARASIDELYQLRKLQYYEVAKNNRYYNSSLMKSKPLELEVPMKRAYGILLYSQDDKQLQDEVIAEIYKIYPPFQKQIKHFSIENAQKAQMDYNRICDANHLNQDAEFAYPFFIAYILLCKFGPDVEDDEIQAFYELLAPNINHWLSFAPSERLEFIDSIKIKELLSIKREQRRLIDLIQTGRDYIDLLHIVDYLENSDSPFKPPATSTEMLSILKTIKEDNANDVYGIWYQGSLFCIALSLHGINADDFLSSLIINKAERDRILKAYANTACYDSRNTRTELSLPDYFTTMLFSQLAKLLATSRDFYFKNNSETQYNELQEMSNRILELNDELSEAYGAWRREREYNETLKAQIENLNRELSKETKDATKPLLDEISLLHSQVAALQETLETEREKRTELNHLREFAFSMENGEDIPKIQISLEPLISGKKIYIFGGHVNWRNKMKAAYPTLNMLDGHNESFDTQLLLNADMVLLNVSNMSHALYYKIIAILRKNEKIQYDYIGKYKNIELMEQEIAAVLQKKMSS